MKLNHEFSGGLLLLGVPGPFAVLEGKQSKAFHLDT